MNETREHRQAVADLATKPVLDYLREKYPSHEFYAKNCSYVDEIAIFVEFRVKQKKGILGIFPKTVAKISDCGWGDQGLTSCDHNLLPQETLEHLVEQGRARQVYYRNIVIDNPTI